MIFTFLSNLLIISGLIFIIIAAVFSIRPLKFASHLHILGLNDPCGTILIMLGLMARPPWNPHNIKLLFLVLITLIVSPLGSYIIVKLNHEDAIEADDEKFDQTKENKEKIIDENSNNI